MNKCYSELTQFETLVERYRYLKLGGELGASTFGFDRYLNQQFYKLKEWKIARVIVHHINPITIDDIKNRNPILFDPEFLISTQLNTHNAIHYGDETLLISETPLERSPNDTKLW